jgi:hypothetical protein
VACPTSGTIHSASSQSQSAAAGFSYWRCHRDLNVISISLHSCRCLLREREWATRSSFSTERRSKARCYAFQALPLIWKTARWTSLPRATVKLRVGQPEASSLRCTYWWEIPSSKGKKKCLGLDKSSDTELRSFRDATHSPLPRCFVLSLRDIIRVWVRMQKKGV